MFTNKSTFSSIHSVYSGSKNRYTENCYLRKRKNYVGSLLVKLITYCLLLALCGCVLFLKPTLEPELILLPPSEGPLPSILKQVVTIKQNEKESSFIVISRFEEMQLKLMVFQATGQTLLSIEYDGEELKYKGLSSISLPSEEMLAIMQFTLWPDSSIKQHYISDNGWGLMMNSEQRILSTRSGSLLTVHYRKQGVVIEHHIHQYQLLIRNLE
jgi:hypothetical protein